ncbi:MAG: Gfo/Idh/MocA family oxidoreductase [Candidatus Sericytochromatia bacterium]|nr:Gfo/Idh/MocA family oxidoreductase [Candidatus Sericytochromatia bacterium]
MKEVEALHDPVRWGVLGAGRAGRARAEAIRDLPGGLLVGLWSRREWPDPVQPMRRARPDVVVIATEDVAHAETIGMALDAGADVLVEYPLVTDPQQAAELDALARSLGRGIRVSWLGWQSAIGRAVREAARVPGPAHWDVRFTGGMAGWVADGLKQGRHATHAAGRLRMLWDLMSGWRHAELVVRESREGVRACFRLEGHRGVTAVLEEIRVADGPRKVAWERDGVAIRPNGAARASAFAADQAIWLRTWNEGGWGLGVQEEEIDFVRACATLERDARQVFDA